MAAPKYQVRQVSVEGSPPVSLEEAIKHLNLPPSTTHHRSEVQLLLDAAEADVEQRVVTRDTTFVLSLWSFPGSQCQCSRRFCDPAGPIIFPRQSLIGVDAIAYTDPDGGSATVDDFTAVPDIRPGYVIPAIGEDWPETQEPHPGTVEVTFRAGPTPQQLNLIKVIMCQLVSTWFETRSGAFTGTISTEMRMSTQRLLTRLDWGEEFLELEHA